MLGIELLNYLHVQVQKACPRIPEQLKDKLEDVTQFVLFYPPQGDKGPYRTAAVRRKLNLTQACWVMPLDWRHLKRFALLLH